MLVILLLVYTATYVPYRVCFVDDNSDFMFIFDTCVDCLFFTDIIFNFFTVIELEDGSYETSRVKIMKNYCKGWFFLDLFTTIPF